MGESDLIFRNRLIYKAPRQNGTISNGNTVPQYFDLNINLACTVPRRGNSSFGPPIFGPIIGDESGYGRLKFSLKMYHNSSFNAAYGSDDFPIMIDEGQMVFLAASVIDVQNVKLSIEVCKVTPSKDPNGPVQHVIIENGYVESKFLFFIIFT